MDDETRMLVLVVLDVEHLDLLLLLLARSLHDLLWSRKCFVVVLDDDLDDRLGRFRVLMVVGCGSTANVVARLVICSGEIGI